MRRLLAGVAVAAFTVPLLATAPHARAAAPAATGFPMTLPWTNERILARADGAPAPSPSPAATVSPDPAQTAKARAEYDAWAAGKPDMTHYVAGASAQLQAAIPQVQAYLAGIGSVKTFTLYRTMSAHGLALSVYRAAAASETAEELISWDAAGKIQLIVFRPVQE